MWVWRSISFSQFKIQLATPTCRTKRTGRTTRKLISLRVYKWGLNWIDCRIHHLPWLPYSWWKTRRIKCKMSSSKRILQSRSVACLPRSREQSQLHTKWQSSCKNKSSNCRPSKLHLPSVASSLTRTMAIQRSRVCRRSGTDGDRKRMHVKLDD